MYILLKEEEGNKNRDEGRRERKKGNERGKEGGRKERKNLEMGHDEIIYTTNTDRLQVRVLSKG